MTDPTLDQRLLAALSKRGDRSIGEFIDAAGWIQGQRFRVKLLSDEELILACEQYANEIENDFKGKP